MYAAAKTITGSMPVPDNKSSYKYFNASTQDIVQEVLDTYRDCNNQVAELVPYLKGKTVLQSCQNVWNAIKDNVRYKIDPQGVQWVRTPARFWRDREGDCKSFSVFAASCLTQMGIPCIMRFASYSPLSPQPTHVYVVVPRGKNEIVVDAVMDGFNKEKPFYHKQDYKMGPNIARLSGIGEANLQTGITLVTQVSTHDWFGAAQTLFSQLGGGGDKTDSSWAARTKLLIEQPAANPGAWPPPADTWFDWLTNIVNDYNNSNVPVAVDANGRPLGRVNFSWIYNYFTPEQWNAVVDKAINSGNLPSDWQRDFTRERFYYQYLMPNWIKQNQPSVYNQIMDVASGKKTVDQVVEEVTDKTGKTGTGGLSTGTLAIAAVAAFLLLRK